MPDEKLRNANHKTVGFFVLRLSAPVAWAGIILWLSLTSTPPQISGPLGWDKLLHCGAYALLTLLIVQLLVYLKGSTGRAWLYSGLAAVCYGGLLEILQLQMQQGRTAEWWDLFADALGAFLAYVIFCHGPRLICSSHELPDKKHG